MRTSRTERTGRSSRNQRVGGGGGGGASLSEAILALDPLGYWKLDDAAGTIAVDQVESPLQVMEYTTPANIALASVEGADGGMYANFNNPDGTGAGCVSGTFDPSYSINPHDGISWCALIRPSNVGSLGLMRASNEWQVRMASNFIGFATQSAGIERQQRFLNNATHGVAIVANEWQLCYGASGATNAAALTLIGVNHDSPGNAAGTGTGGAAASSPFRIGSIFISSSTVYWKGALAHVAVFPGVKSASDFQGIIDAAVAEGWIPAP